MKKRSNQQCRFPCPSTTSSWLAGLEPGKHGLSDLSERCASSARSSRASDFDRRVVGLTEQIGLQTLSDIRHRR